MDQGEPSATLRPSILDPGGTSLVNMEPETMDTSLNLTSGMRGTETQAAATGTTATTAGPSTEGLQIVLDQNTLGKLNEFGVAREDIGRLFVSFLTYLATAQQGKGAQPAAAEKVSSSLGQEYPTIAQAAQLTKTPLKSQNAKPNETEATLLAENMEDNSWTPVQNRRRRKRPLTSIEEPEKKAAAMSIDERPESKTTRAIVLKPVCKEAVNGFRARDIRQAAETAGIESQENFKIQYQTKTNTITLTTQEEGTAEKLLRLKAIEKNGKQYTVCPYRAMEKNQIRGVIYPPGDNSEETPETLLADMKCDKARIIAARLMGKGTSSVLVTFEGNKLPKKVVFCQAILSVKEYRPRPIVCFSCHELGHKADVCPRKERRCGQCGNVHDEGMDECDREPKCRNCDGPHPATSNDCPRRRIPDKKKMTPKPPAQSKESYAAAAKSITERPKASGKNDQDELPTWIPEWAKSTQRQQPSQQASDFDAEKEMNKLKNDVHIGFKMIFEAIGEIKKELALLRHGK